MKRLLTLALISGGLVCAQTVTLGSALQPIDGFGASVAFTRFTFSTAQINFYFGTVANGGLGLSLMRLDMYPDLASCIEDNTSLINCVNVSSGATTTVWELNNALAAQALNTGVRFWAASWSPPGAMKSNGDYETGGGMVSGSGNANYTALAAAYAAFPTLITGTYGIPLIALSYQNEPDQDQPYPSCTWTTTQIHDFVPYFHAALIAAGYPNIKIITPEASGWELTYAAPIMNDITTAGETAIVAAHAYNGSYTALTLGLLANVTTQHLWQSEVMTYNDTYDGTTANGLGWAQQIYLWMLGSGVSAWEYWLLNGQGVYNDNEALSSVTGVAPYPKRAYVLGSLSGFVRPGWSEHSVTNQNAGGLDILAFTNGSTGLVFWVVNNQSSAVSNQSFNVGGFPATAMTPYIVDATRNIAAQTPVAVSGGAFSYTIPADSAVTLVFLAPNSTGSTLNGGLTLSGRVQIN